MTKNKSNFSPKVNFLAFHYLSHQLTVSAPSNTKKEAKLAGLTCSFALCDFDFSDSGA